MARSRSKKNVELTEEQVEEKVVATETPETTESEKETVVEEKVETKKSKAPKSKKEDVAAEEKVEPVKVKNVIKPIVKNASEVPTVKAEVKEQPKPKTINTFKALLNQRVLRSRGAYSQFQEELARRQGKMPSTKVGFDEVLKRRLARKF